MAYNNHPDDQPPKEWRRVANNDEVRAAMPAPSLQDPVAVGQMFCNALRHPNEFLVVLQRLITPESVEAWGDFSQASDILESIPDVGYGTRAERALGDENIAYFKILSGVTESFEVLEEQFVLVAALLTLAWRPEFDEWRVHSIGDSLPPELVPH